MDTTSTQAAAEEPKATDDYSDIASEHSGSEHKKERRRYQRGGRKESRGASTKEEIELLEGANDGPDDSSKSKLEKPSSPCPYCSGTQQSTEKRATPEKPQTKESSPRKQSIPEPFDTGIRAFNIRKAAGGRRPVNIRAPSGRKKSQASPSKRTKKKTTREQTSDEGEDQTEGDESDTRTASDKHEPEEREEPPGKPMSIRLDLNLIVEVFLKAKIKGDVTITFLE